MTAKQQGSVSDERAAEIKALIAAARKRQDIVDQPNTDLWVRWEYAVCIGCGPRPKKLRMVYTHPRRVLQGIPAAIDDRRERRGRHV